jgi:predicted DNA-binding helix-hairpin-helix protein
MEYDEDLISLIEAASDERCDECVGRVPDRRDLVTYVTGPGGRPMPILKTLQSTVCKMNCLYCATRRDRDVRRRSMNPDELASLFHEFLSHGLVEGIFLSSGIVGDSDRTMERIVETARIIRKRYGFKGYIHLKIMPGASDAAIEDAISLATRVSVNIEAPNRMRLSKIAPEKDFDISIQTIRRARKLIMESGLQVSQTTQLVVGASGETDREILESIGRLYKELGVSRAYFSGFRPVPDTPLDNLPPADPRRIARLYQADFLIRRYGFEVEEIPLEDDGNLSLGIDPKMKWAISHPEFFPVEVNTADREILLKVPGIGPKSAWKILMMRREGGIRGLEDLKRAGVWIQRASGFITINGRRPLSQLSLDI